MLKKSVIWLVLTAVFCGIFPLASLAEPQDVNLAEGLTYQVSTGDLITSSYASFGGEGAIYDIDEGQLTDSNLAYLSADSANWYRAYRGVSRVITFDLGAVCSISGIEAGFLHAKASGIYAPRYINVRLSDDGETYGTAVEFETKYPLSSSTVARYDASVKFSKTYSAQFVKIEICCDNLLYCDEIKIIGSKTLSGSEAKVKPDDTEIISAYPPSVAGVSNIVKVYNGFNSENPDAAAFIESELLPYVAYIDQNGEIAGTMFDAMIFSPSDGIYPSGGSLARRDDVQGAVMSDWELYLKYTFKAGSDIYALDRAVGNAYSKIGSESKFKVFLTIPYPTVIDSPFGDIDNDGLDEYCRTFDERFDVVKWYVDECIRIFKENNYSNIVLAGFCWGSEKIDFADSDHESELVGETNEYVQKLGYETLFTSSYLSVGFDSWKELGFSDAVMQPNAVYADSNGFELGVISECAMTAAKYQMGIEIELADAGVFRGDGYLKAGFNYESHLYYGRERGYISGLKTFNHGMGDAVLYDFCYADMSTPKGIYLRRLYDLTFSFLHLTYSNQPPELYLDNEIELVNGDTNITLNLGVTDNDSHWDDIRIEFPQMPSHGVVAAASNKKALIYSADNDFVGEDMFTVRVSDGFGYSEEIEVKVTVVVPELPDAAKGNSSNQDASIVLPPRTEESVPLWLAVILFILAAAIVCVAVMTIKNSKNKKGTA